MDAIHDLVNEIMRTFREPYSEDIIDDMFCKIEANSAWLNRYNAIVKAHGKFFVNPQIGRLVKEYTGLNTLSFPNKPKSNLIKSYSKLGDNNKSSYPEVE